MLWRPNLGRCADVPVLRQANASWPTLEDKVLQRAVLMAAKGWG